MIIMLDAFKALVKARCGLVFDHSNSANLANAIVERMAVNKITEVATYFTHLNIHEDEFHELVTRLTINETYFFREAEHLSLLTHHILPARLAQSSKDNPVRILSAGCSTGEEPYSIAIALHENFPESMWERIQLVGADIDHRALRQAEQARYNNFSFRGLSSERRLRYFDKIDTNLYSLKAEIRTRVRFRQLNLLATDVVANLPAQDVVFFRNVSIYFDIQTRKIVQTHLHRVLKDQGILIVGTAESMANDLGIFELAEEKELFYFKKKGADLPETKDKLIFPGIPLQDALPDGNIPKLLPDGMPLPHDMHAKNTLTTKEPPATHTPHHDRTIANTNGTINHDPTAEATHGSAWDALEGVLSMIEEERYPEAQNHLKERLHRVPTDKQALLLAAYIALQVRDFTKARDYANEVLKQDSWNIDAFMLLGFCAKWQPVTDHEAAVRWFKQVVYVCHDCWVAHYYLAESYRILAQQNLARRTYKVVLQQLATNPRPNGGLFLPLRISINEIRFLCEHHAK